MCTYYRRQVFILFHMYMGCCCRTTRSESDQLFKWFGVYSALVSIVNETKSIIYFPIRKYSCVAFVVYVIYVSVRCATNTYVYTSVFRFLSLWSGNRLKLYVCVCIFAVISDFFCLVISSSLSFHHIKCVKHILDICSVTFFYVGKIFASFIHFN